MRLIEGTFAVEIRPVLARVVGVPLTERFTRSRRSTWKAYSLKASPTRTRPRERSGSGFPPTPPDNPVRPCRDRPAILSRDSEHAPDVNPIEETAMTGDPSKIIVTTGATADAVQVHQHDIPELQCDGESPVIAAENLANALTREVDSVSDHHHREALQQALADVRAFVERSS